MPGVRVALDGPVLDPDALGRAVAGFVGALRAVQLDQLGVVHVRAEGPLYGVQVHPMPVCGDLDPVAEPGAQVRHEHLGRPSQASSGADAVALYQGSGDAGALGRGRPIHIDHYA